MGCLGVLFALSDKDLNSISKILSPSFLNNTILIFISLYVIMSHYTRL